MKFVCRKCETFMKFDEVEAPGEQSLGVTFSCADCGARISMVTNAGETMMVKALGVKLGGRDDAPEPLELTRRSLAGAPAPASTVRSPGAVRIEGGSAEAASTAAQASMGKCPFANNLGGLLKTGKTATDGPSAAGGAAAELEVSWSAEAWLRLGRVPAFVRSYAKTMIEAMAREKGVAVIDDALMDEAKEKFM